MNKIVKTEIAIGITLILVVIINAFFLFHQKKTRQAACTMEARMCPDGTAVGRSGPNCEFAPCPIMK